MTLHRITDDPEIISVLDGIYPIINISPDKDLESVLDWAVNLYDAGIRLVQLRAKKISGDVLPAVLDDFVSNLKGSGLMVLLNDYVELVGITGADGVHLGLDDFPVVEARALLGHKAIIGVTARDASDALMGIGQGASYVAAGSIYESPTKGGIPVIGLEGMKDILEHINKESVPRHGWGRFGHAPVCAIGGITKDNLSDVYNAGASMVAVIGAIQGTDDPVKSAGELVKAWVELDKAKV